MNVPAASSSILEQLANLLSGRLKLRPETFSIANGLVECDLAGTFAPVCGEMESLAEINFDDLGASSHPSGNALVFTQGQQFSWNGPANSLYTEVLKTSTALESVRLAITGSGFFEISIFAHKNGLHKLMQRQVVRFTGERSEARLSLLDLATQPPNTALYISARCLAGQGVIFGFRWLGQVSLQKANLGERIYLIRTFNAAATVRQSLARICARLAATASGQAVLRRTQFIIYDASQQGSQLHIPNARVLELRGPNFGGGGNASLLASLLLRLGQKYETVISDLLIMDDDARVDAETIIRQDAFITCRKKDVISTAVIFNADEPCQIQNAGACWGKFFSPVTHRLDASHAWPETMLTCELRRGQALDSLESVRDFAVSQAAQYGAFIFISFPYELLLRVGAPYPFFLRNDDAEICLRCLKAGATLAVNQNLHVWHGSSHDEVSEFYSVLHGLVLNAAFGLLRQEYVTAIFMERIGKIARAGNCALLQAYSLALHKFAEGPDWQQPERIFQEYLDCEKRIRSIFRQQTAEVPECIFSASQNPAFVVDRTDALPGEPLHDLVLLRDQQRSRYYQYDPASSHGICAELLAQACSALCRLNTNFDSICKSWQKAIAGFDHLDFWNRAAPGQEIGPVAMQDADPKGFAQVAAPTAGADAVSGLERPFAQLPPDFDEAEYLRLNPDLANLTIPPQTHWLRHGRREGRRYK